MDSCENIMQKLKNDRFATQAAGIVIDELRPDYARCTMRVGQTHLNANDVVMGGAVFTLADYAFAAASNSAGADTVSLSSNITFLGAAGEGETLCAEAVCVRTGRNTCVFTIDVTSGSGKRIALITASGFRR